MKRPASYRPFLFALLAVLLVPGRPARTEEPKRSRADFSGAGW